MTATLLAIGLTTLDIVARPIDALTRTEAAILVEGIACAPAGTAAGAALVAARLGVKTALAGAVGDDMNGGFVRQGLESLGVDTALLDVRAGQRTSTTLLTVESGGVRSGYHMLGAGFFPPASEAVAAAARSARFVHYGAVGGLSTDGGPGEALLRAAKAAGAVVTCDLIAPRPGAAEELARLLPHVDYFMPSAAEARFLTGKEDLAQAAAQFRAQGAAACIIKNGRDGALAVLGGEARAVPAFAVEPLDTTSCGDAFCAGFIAALGRGHEPLAACRFAAMTAGLVAEGLATLGALKGFEDTLAAMKSRQTLGAS